ncbi:MAG: 2,3-bisphosphoglycerate-independent phosphoglycerate mutase [Gemmatimonadota bacterium]
MDLSDIAALAQPGDRKVLLLVLDGLGGLAAQPGGKTALETARTPNLDALVGLGGCGVQTPVAPGVTPGSGPGHLSLFGYDPLRYRIGRGVLSALGIGFDLQPGDVAVRGNLCSVDPSGVVTDRRAGRIAADAARQACDLLAEIQPSGAEAFVRHVKEHRFLLVLRTNASSSADILDTDTGRTGVPPRPITARSQGAVPAASAAREWVERASFVLADHKPANMVLLRGFASLPDWPRFPDVFQMRALAIAAYPMYLGVARLIGMEAVQVEDSPDALAEELERRVDEHDFFFLHVKGTDKAGEDGDFERKVSVIEDVDSIVPRLVDAVGGVTLVTGDHSTPATMKAHSWHPVPFLLSGGPAREALTTSFGESECARGSLGHVNGWDLLPMAAARAGRLAKYGA